MYGKLKEQLQQELNAIESAGLYKKERTILTEQGADIKVNGGLDVINFCANNYLGLSSNQRVVQAAKDTLSWIWTFFSSLHLWYSRYSQRIGK